MAQYWDEHRERKALKPLDEAASGVAGVAGSPYRRIFASFQQVPDFKIQLKYSANVIRRVIVGVANRRTKMHNTPHLTAGPLASQKMPLLILRTD